MSDIKRNTRGGAGWKARKTGKQHFEKKIEEFDVESGGNYYAEVTRLLGGNRIEAKLHTGNIVQARIPGIMYKKKGNWMKVGTTIFINGINDFYEVIRIVKDSNNDATKAKSMISKSNNSIDIFGDEEKSDTEDDLENFVNPNINTQPIDKTIVNMKRKEDDKERTITNSKEKNRQFSNHITSIENNLI